MKACLTIKPIWAKVPAFAVFQCVSILLSFSQQATQNPGVTFRAQSSLVLVDVITRDVKSGRPIENLKKDDFRVFDNGHEVGVTTFDSGAQLDTQPIVLWLVVICEEQYNASLRSGAFAGREALFRPALNSLQPRDRLGVAHWCDNGDVRIDLQPTNNTDAAIAALARALKPIPFVAPSDTRTGQIAEQAMVRLILLDSHQRDPQPLPVIVFLHADYTAMSLYELDLVIDDILETSGIAFGIKDAKVRGIRPYIHNQQDSIFHYMAEQTGGQYFSVPGSQYADALEDILLQVHFRYQVGFHPPSVDGKRHHLKVELVKETQKKYRAQLRYRPEYIPTSAEMLRKR